MYMNTRKAGDPMLLAGARPDVAGWWGARRYPAPKLMAGGWDGPADSVARLRGDGGWGIPTASMGCGAWGPVGFVWGRKKKLLLRGGGALGRGGRRLAGISGKKGGLGEAAGARGDTVGGWCRATRNFGAAPGRRQ